jgi:hypothetical protein
MNFADEPREIPVDGPAEVVLSTAAADLSADRVLLTPKSGALLR